MYRRHRVFLILALACWGLAGCGSGKRSEGGPPEGKAVYAGVCLPCHGMEGKGQPGSYPPLAGSEWANGGEAWPVRIVLHGLRGPVEVNGDKFAGEMPALGGQLSDAEVAAVLSYVRASFGNKGAPVSEAAVAKIRAANPRPGPWSADELRSLR